MIIFIVLILTFGVGCFCFGLMIGVHHVARGASRAFREADVQPLDPKNSFWAARQHGPTDARWKQ